MTCQTDPPACLRCVSVCVCEGGGVRVCVEQTHLYLCAHSNTCAFWGAEEWWGGARAAHTSPASRANGGVYHVTILPRVPRCCCAVAVTQSQCVCEWLHAGRVGGHQFLAGCCRPTAEQVAGRGAVKRKLCGVESVTCLCMLLCCHCFVIAFSEGGVLCFHPTSYRTELIVAIPPQVRMCSAESTVLSVPHMGMVQWKTRQQDPICNSCRWFKTTQHPHEYRHRQCFAQLSIAVGQPVCSQPTSANAAAASFNEAPSLWRLRQAIHLQAKPQQPQQKRLPGSNRHPRAVSCFFVITPLCFSKRLHMKGDYPLSACPLMMAAAAGLTC